MYFGERFSDPSNSMNNEIANMLREPYFMETWLHYKHISLMV